MKTFESKIDLAPQELYFNGGNQNMQTAIPMDDYFGDVIEGFKKVCNGISKPVDDVARNEGLQQEQQALEGF